MNSQRVILSFVRRAQCRALIGAALAAAGFAGAVGGAGWWLALRLAPAQANAIAAVVACLVLALVGYEVARARLSVAGIDASAGAGDALLTYWPRRRAPKAGMAAWLEAWLALRLQQQPVPVSVRRRAVRTARRLLPLLPLLLLLLLLCLFWPAGLGQGSRHGLGGAPQSGDEPAAAGGGDATAPPRDGEARPDSKAPPRVPPPNASPGAGDAGAAVAGRPVDLPVRDEFVVPAFVGAGESRTAKVRQAEQDVVASAPPATSIGGATPDAPSPSTADFQRAVERATTARHVPDAERPIVQRYFRALAERR